MRLIEVLGLKWPKNEVFGLLKKIESLDLAENGLKRCLLLLYNFSRKPHILENSQKPQKRGFNLKTSKPQNWSKKGKLSKRVKTISKTHKKSQKIRKKLKKYFWGQKKFLGPKNGQKGVKIGQKKENYQKGS